MKENEMTADFQDSSQRGEWADLIQLARGGNKEALGHLFQEYRPYLLQIAREEIDAELQAKVGGSDLVQESFVEAQKAFGNFPGTKPEEFRAWLREILLNNIRDLRKFYRAEKRDVGREYQSLQDSGPLVGKIFGTSEPTPPPHQAIHREIWERVESILSGFGEVQRQVLVLRQRGNKTFAHIGQELGLSEDAARKTWARCIEELRKKIDLDQQSR